MTCYWVHHWDWGFDYAFQEKEYKDALEAFNEKNREKVQLITKLMEVSQSHMLNHGCEWFEFEYINFPYSNMWDIAIVFCSVGGWKWKIEDEEAGGAE